MVNRLNFSLTEKASAHQFKVGVKVLITNYFYTIKIPKLALNFKGPADNINFNYINAKVKIGNKIKVLNINKLKLFLQEQSSETDTEIQDFNFNYYHTDKPITRAHARLINYKIAAHLDSLCLTKKVVKTLAFLVVCDGHLTILNKIHHSEISHKSAKIVKSAKNYF
jgi:hypothetical protein